MNGWTVFAAVGLLFYEIVVLVAIGFGYDARVFLLAGAGGLVGLAALLRRVSPGASQLLSARTHGLHPARSERDALRVPGVRTEDAGLELDAPPDDDAATFI